MSRAPVLPVWSAPATIMGDSRLALRAVRGDARAFEAIFRRHHQELYRYCRAILADPDDAQDALQATMAAALRSLPGERREIALRPWLYRVAHNEAISLARRRRDQPLAEEAEGVAPGADVDAEDRERLRTLVADLASLPERQRGALVMRELSGLSYPEIADALGASEAAARQIVYEAREAMREAGLAREADCAEIRKLISDGDGRVLRGRRVRAHLRSCQGCGDYRAGISQRQGDLRMLAPPLPAVAATALLAGLAGEGGKAGIAASLGSAGATVVGKGGAMIAAVALGTGAAGLSGAVDLPFAGGTDGAPVPAAEQATVAPEQAGVSGIHAPPVSSDRTPAGGGARDTGERAGARGSAHGDAHASRDGAGNGPTEAAQDSRGASVRDEVPAPPEQAVGAGVPGSAGTGEGNAGGSSAAAPGRAAAPPRAAPATTEFNADPGEPPDHASGQGQPEA